MIDAKLRRRADRGLWPLFAAQVAARPDAPALLTEAGPTSYRALADRAEAIAAALAASGVRRGDYVALLASRGADAIAAMRGCLRAGAAYVPPDPTHAPEQLAFIAGDLPFRAALVTPRHAALAPATLPADLPVLALDAALMQGRPSAPSAPDPGYAGGDPAYVMYTSGTTGTPKGVIVAQRGVAGIALAQPMLDPGPDDRMLHAATIAADGSTFEIWGALLNGAALAVVEAEKPALDEIARVMRHHRVTFALWYAGLHHLMIDHQLCAFESLRKTVSGGDTVSPAHISKLQEAWPQLAAINVFGTTRGHCGQPGHEDHARPAGRRRADRPPAGGGRGLRRGRGAGPPAAGRDRAVGAGGAGGGAWLSRPPRQNRRRLRRRSAPRPPGHGLSDRRSGGRRPERRLPLPWPRRPDGEAARPTD